MVEIGSGTRGVQGRARRWVLRGLGSPTDVIELMDAGGVEMVALVHDAGATFLAPIFHELTAVLRTGGTPRSHIGIVSREFQVPCLMGCTFPGGEPSPGWQVKVDCSSPDGDHGVVRG